MRALEKTLLDWAFVNAPELNDAWMNAKDRKEQAGASAEMFRRSVSNNNAWLMWAATHHKSDLVSLYPYCGRIEAIPAGMPLPVYVKAMEDCGILF